MDPQSPDSAAIPRPEAKKTAQRGFFERVFSFLFVSNDPEHVKQRALKQIGKDLKKSRPRYFTPAQYLAESSLARYFYEFYKTFAPAQVLLRGARESGVLKSILIEAGFTETQSQLKEQLSEEAIQERVKGADPSAVGEQVKDEARQFVQSFDVGTMNEIDAAYNRLAILLDLIDFDYYFLLRKFDSAIPERDFAYRPRFEAINCEYVLDELKDFLEIVPAIDTEADWDQLLGMLKEYRGVEVVPRDGMRKVIQLVKDTQRSNVFLSIVRFMDKNPYYKPLLKVHHERIVEQYISKVKSQAEITIQKIAQSRKNEKITQLTQAVFGTSSVSRLSNYSEKTNMTFSKKMLGGFTHVTTLNYLKAFLLDYFKKNIREIVDLLLIKGKWADHSPSQTVSEAYHQLLKISESISRFDEALAEDGELGHKMRAVVVRADRDKKAIVNLRTLLQEINDQAGAMIGEATQHFVSIARILKMVFEDYGKTHPELIINWRELKSMTDKDMRTLVAGVYKQIYSFVQLLQIAK
jgi:hypothetical protein